MILDWFFFNFMLKKYPSRSLSARLLNFLQKFSKQEIPPSGECSVDRAWEAGTLGTVVLDLCLGTSPRSHHPVPLLTSLITCWPTDSVCVCGSLSSLCLWIPKGRNAPEAARQCNRMSGLGRDTLLNQGWRHKPIILPHGKRSLVRGSRPACATWDSISKRNKTKQNKTRLRCSLV